MVINFNDLDLESGEPEVVKKRATKSDNRISAESLGIPRKLSASESKARKDELHKIEPGYKVAILSVGTIIGCWCENCGDMEMHVLKFDGSKIRCMNCKQDRKLKVKKL